MEALLRGLLHVSTSAVTFPKKITFESFSIKTFSVLIQRHGASRAPPKCPQSITSGLRKLAFSNSYSIISCSDCDSPDPSES